MLFKNKGIPDATVVKLLAKVLKSNPSPVKGFKVNTSEGKKTVTYDELIRFTEALALRLDDGRYGVIRRCDTCGNFNRSGKAGKRGWCSPKEHTQSRYKTDYCSMWIPMTPEQKRIKETINGHFKSIQTK